MRFRLTMLLVALVFAACSPAESGDPRAAAGTWPPKDYNDFAARPPMSVGAELDDEWNMAIEAERWSYLIGVAIVAAGGAPPSDAATPIPAPHLARTAQGLNEAAQRLIVLRNVTCRTPPIAKPADCAAFAAPSWTSATAPASKDELQARLQWFESNAYKFVQPACAVAIRRTGDERFCAVE
jgi:hypothetical protein